MKSPPELILGGAAWRKRVRPRASGNSAIEMPKLPWASPYQKYWHADESGFEFQRSEKMSGRIAEPGPSFIWSRRNILEINALERK
jgi:hypothetical protein